MTEGANENSLVFKGYNSGSRDTMIILFTIPFLCPILGFALSCFGTGRSFSLNEMLLESIFWQAVIFMLLVFSPLLYSVLRYETYKCTISCWGDFIKFMGLRCFRKPIVKIFRKDEIDYVLFRKFDNYFNLRLSSRQKCGPKFKEMKYAIHISSSFFTKDDFITLCKVINSAILKKKSKRLMLCGNALEFFGHSNERLVETLEREFETVKIKYRKK